MGWGWAAGVAAAVFAATIGLTGALRRWLLAHEILDRPVARSSHDAPVPRGGGLAVVAVLAVGWLAIAARDAPAGTVVAVACACGLAVLSWRDDLGGLPVPLRLAAHALMVLVGVAAMPQGAVFQGALPPLLDRAAAALAWLWFVELYNFMDGIDGIAGIETAMLGGGIALVLGVAGAGGDGMAALALAAAAAGAAFLRWNWHKAKIFLGDVGSVPLGYLIGWLLLLLAARGMWAPALILPLYYVADASITLARRVARRAPFWQAHREHFYQRALGRDGDHAAVARMILVCDLGLVALALLALRLPGTALALAVAVVAILLALMQRRSRHG
ncbi:MAG TPA: glycosyl transferase [Stellaceae bacterium]|nr:glycosyl transferase [Stellaceae bacterium]